VDDWETFFAEKSRRRADVARRAERKRRNDILIAAVLMGALLIGAIVGLMLLRP
jgi:hypothetical protein